ncbi:sensor histidine kinase [Nitrosospira sp. Nsp13]|uniref:sensor histidine kinase n=1 Tax=Nitrosospira sp. Nsp13 TaxID=1855332 RepID=UPI000881F9A3|nr:ATP-binding protein [Nitrosospira sp. Nsp13]SCX80634.1 Histidine kinase-, DNA gyrase B-, and HSP90-like ATPase [Nitrosospira sp. Nsp13]
MACKDKSSTDAVRPATEEPASAGQALRERLKEITCLYEIRRGMGLELSVEIVCQNIFEHLIPAMQFPEIATAMIELDGRRFTSENHGQGLTHELQSKISANDELRGQLRVFYPEDKPFLMPEEQRLIDTVASDLEKWLERKQIDGALRERLKEITCLYEIRRGMGLELSVDNVCQNIFEHLIPAMQFPEIATAMIELDGKRFTSENHGQGLTHELQSKISVNHKTCGQLRVFYPEDKPFLVPEEQRLIDAVASDLEKWLERKQIDEALHERLKEITCLYEIRRGMGLELSVDNACRHIFEYLIPAMQFPEIATALIELDGRRFTSENHGQGLTHELQAKISANNKPCGQLRVFYPEDKPFLVPEEQRLIDAVASDLERWLERKRLEQALVSIAEEQQRLIGQELHDNLGQQIAAISYQAKALEKKIATSSCEDAATVAASIATQAQVAVMQCKQIAQGLLPFELETNGLTAALRAFASRIAITYKITCDFVCENEVLIKDKDLALNLYRIVQEATNNAIRHGGAQHVAILLAVEEEMLHLSISDNGSGFAGTDTKHGVTPGMGIKIMQYRARQHGAMLEFLSRAEGGVEVRLEMRIV